MTIDTSKLKQKLEEEKKLLEEELGNVGRQNPLNPNDWEATGEKNTERADLNVKADVHEDIEERHAITDTLETRLRNVNTALEKLEKGEYGVCEVCGEHIEEDRLFVNPAARTCKKDLGEENDN